jgi:hypothetical protein
MRGHDDPIMHPLPLPPRRDDTGAAEVSQVTRNLRLRAAKDLNKIANTNLLVANEIQYPEPGVIPESLKEPFHVEGLFRCHIYLCIRLDVCESETYSRLSECLENICQGSYWIR